MYEARARWLVSSGDLWPLPRTLEDGPWVNAETGLSREALEGAPTLVVRWRAGDLASVAALAAARGSGVRAIGLHVPGHPREREVERVRRAVLREGIHAPVRVDADGALAEALGLEAPSDALLLDEHARPTARETGGVPAQARELEAVAPGTGAAGFGVRGDALGPSRLAYPQGLATRGDRLAVADTAHHRVLVRDPDGSVRAFGSGAPGLEDGARSRARFSRPRGMAWTDDGLWVADAGNGCLRRVDLAGGQVSTPVESRALDPAPGAPHGPTPTDLAQMPGTDGVLAVALATRGILARVDAGDGEVLDPIDLAGLEQPTGLTAAGDRLLVVDPLEGVLAEASTGSSPRVLAERGSSPLEHPVALAARGDEVRVADAYADALLRVPPDTGHVERLEGEGVNRLVEPRAIAPAGEAWWTVDAGNRLRRVEGSRASAVRLPAPDEADPPPIPLDPVELAPGGELVVRLAARGVPDPEAVDPGRPSASGPIQVRTVDGVQARSNAVWTGLGARVEASGALLVRWPMHRAEGGSVLAWRFDVIVRPGGPERVELRLTAPVDAGGGPGGRSP